MNLYQHAKNQFISFAQSSDRVNFRVLPHDWPHPLLTTPTPKFLTSFYLHEFVPACKKSVNSCDAINLRVQRPDLLNLLWRNSSFRNYAIWLSEYFCLHLRNKIFPKHRICAGTQQIINIFIIEQIQWKLMTKFFFKFKKPIFGPFPNFWGKKYFSKKLGCHAQLHNGFMHPGTIQRNLMIKFRENAPTMAGGKDGQNLFYRILPATARGLTSTTVVYWHLKIKNKKCNVVY